jgi:16S rRNA processing protein RimM
MAERILVARIGAAHGIRGEVRLRSFTADPLAAKNYGPLETEDGTRTFTIEALRPQKDFLVARLAGIGDRTAAERLRNVSLYVARDRLPPAEADEFYHADLIGLAVETTDGRPLGTVIAVHNFGAGDLLEVKPAAGAALMLPFTQSAVPVVDIAGRRIVVAQWDEQAPPGPTRARRRASRDA